MKIHLITGYSDRGGSTIALIRLTNLFNKNGLDATLYGPQRWHLDKCQSGDANNYVPDENTIVISHYCQLKLPCAKHILACHETNMFDMRDCAKDKIDASLWDNIVYVSNFQKQWHGVDENVCSTMVIPNIVTTLKNNGRAKKENKDSVAGVIGSIDSHKLTHLSIRRAVNDGFGKVEIFGKLSDPRYFSSRVLQMLNRNVCYVGYNEDLQDIYNGLDAVYHSSQRETYNFVKFECQQAGVDYFANPESDNDAEYWDEEKIFNAWVELF